MIREKEHLINVEMSWLCKQKLKGAAIFS